VILSSNTNIVEDVAVVIHHHFFSYLEANGNMDIGKEKFKNLISLCCAWLH
jgi:hypothetical protein